jgi:hypothetical protein
MLATYQLIVRNTFIGGWLNGRRYRWRGRVAPAVEPVPAN